MSRIKVKHIRTRDMKGNIISRGGVTVAAEVDAQGRVIRYGVAKCRKTDNFVKKLGITKATSRMNSLVDRRYTSFNWDMLVDSMFDLAHLDQSIEETCLLSSPKR